MGSVRGLGPMERKIMEYIWCREKATVAQVHSYLSEQRVVAYTTVMTIMSRLVVKGFLNREKIGKAYSYKCAKSKGAVVKHLVHTAFQTLVTRFGNDAIVAFADEIDKLPTEKRKKLIASLLEE